MMPTDDAARVAPQDAAEWSKHAGEHPEYHICCGRLVRALTVLTAAEQARDELAGWRPAIEQAQEGMRNWQRACYDAAVESARLRNNLAMLEQGLTAAEQRAILAEQNAAAWETEAIES